ncbi:MAG: glycosyltransferase [Synergistaceae bacterium]|jgi:glycosyltransferase involved in cell wall biosynthesis|nr:glycosyltransferase [Synergistaceae bacterium]
MRITLLCSDLRFESIQRIVPFLADELSRKEDFVVDLALLHGEGEFLSLHSSAVSVVSLDNPLHALRSGIPLLRLAHYFQKAKPDVVLSFGYTANCLAAMGKQLFHFFFRLIVSEPNMLELRKAEKSKFQRWRRAIPARFLYRNAELCVCASRGIARGLMALRVVPRRKIRVIYNPVDGPWVTARIAEPVKHPWFQTSEENKPPVIFCAGDPVHLKGMNVLLRAFSLLRDEMNFPARLMIVAEEGEDRKRLETLAEVMKLRDDICFLERGATSAYMAKAALMVLMSSHENFPSLLAEALACGVNVISAGNRQGPREILEDGKWGRLVPENNVDALAAALRETLESPMAPEILKKRAADFSMRRSFEEYCRAIQYVLNPHDERTSSWA